MTITSADLENVSIGELVRAIAPDVADESLVESTMFAVSAALGPLHEAQLLAEDPAAPFQINDDLVVWNAVPIPPEPDFLAEAADADF